jgi:hypothetical protein
MNVNQTQEGRVEPGSIYGAKKAMSIPFLVGKRPQQGMENKG